MLGNFGPTVANQVSYSAELNRVQTPPCTDSTDPSLFIHFYQMPDMKVSNMLLVNASVPPRWSHHELDPWLYPSFPSIPRGTNKGLEVCLFKSKGNSQNVTSSVAQGMLWSYHTSLPSDTNYKFWTKSKKKKKKKGKNLQKDWKVKNKSKQMLEG